jgi:hypothetical protein
MSAQVSKMMGRFQKTGLKLFSESTKALTNPTVQYAIGAILVLYITFLESETESVLSVAMTNPLGRLLVLLVLLLLVSVSVPLGILFAILIVMSCANRENFESLPSGNFTVPMNPPDGFQDDGGVELAVQSAQQQSENTDESKSFEEAFLSNHGMSPELLVDDPVEFEAPEPATGNTGDKRFTGEVSGFTSTETTHSLF